MIKFITNHVSVAWYRLVSQFKRSVQFLAILKSFSLQIQEIEDALVDVYSTYRSVDTATGDSLDRLGRMVGAPLRGTRNDTDYRRRVKAQIVLNKSSGDYDTLYRASKIIVTAYSLPSAPLFLDTNTTNAECEVVPVSGFSIGTANIRTDDNECRDLAKSLSVSGSAGVRFLVWSYPSIGSLDAFRFDQPDNTSQGFDQAFFSNVYDGT